MIDYKNALCVLIEDMGGEITIQKSALSTPHILHYFEDDNEVVIVSEEKKCRK